MRKQIAAFLIPSAILGVLLHDVFNTPFYSEAELRHVSESAVKVAREGDTADALKRFDALIDVAPDSPAVWADYLVVLPWAGESAKALDLANRLSFPVEKLPAYTQRSLFESALRQNRLAMAQRYAQNYIDRSKDQYAAMLDSVGLLLSQSQPAMTLALLSRYDEKYPNDQAILLRRVAAQLQLSNPQQISKLPDLISYSMDKPEERKILSQSLVNASRFRSDERYLPVLETFYKNEPSALFAADYLTVLVWHKHFAEAVVLYDQWQDQLPDYAQKAAMIALAETGRNAEAVKLLSAIERNKRLPDDQRIAVIRPLIANGGAVEAYQLLEDESGLVYEDLRWQSLTALGRDEELFAAMGKRLQQIPADDDLSLRWLAVYQRLIADKKNPDLSQFVGSASSRVQDEVIRDLIARNQLADAQTMAAQLHRETEFWLMVEQTARRYRQQKKYMQALDLYRYALSSPANAVDAELGIILTLRAQGRMLDAVSAMDNAVQNYPDNRQVADTAIDIYRSAGNNRRLLPLFEKNWQLTGDRNYLRSWIGVVRSGNPYASLEEQRAAISVLQKRYPGNIYLNTQKLLIGAESGECLDELTISFSELSAFEIEQLAFAMRRCEKTSLAIDLYRYGQQRFAKNPVFSAGLILSYTQQQNFTEADRCYQILSAAIKKSRDVQLARAWWLAQQQRYAEASNLYQQISRRYPDNQEAFVGQVMNTNKAGQVEQAWVLAELHQQWFSADELARLQADRIAWTLRQATELSGDERNRLLQRALIQIDSYFSYLQKYLPNDRDKFLTLRWDKQLALHLSGRHEDVVQDFQLAGVPVVDVPVYALLTVADSQSALRKYTDAEAVLLQALQREPENPRVLRSLYFVYLSLDNYPAAEKILLTMKAQTPDGPVDKTTGQVYWAWRQQAMFAAYRNQLADAEKMLQQFQKQAPQDVAVRQDLALVERWRGKPEAALHFYQENLHQEPHLLDAKIGEAHALLDDRQHRSAGEKVMQLAADNKSHPQVKELQRRWDVHNLREFDNRILVGRSDGAVYGGKEFTSDSWLYDTPENYSDGQIDYRWFAHHIYSAADFEGNERNGRMQRIGGGISVNDPDWQIQWDVEISQAVTSDSDKGISLRGTWRPDDFWYVGVNAQTYSLDVPVRAINMGLSGQSIALSSGYRWNESSRVDVTTGVVDINGGQPTLGSGVNFYQEEDLRRYFSVAYRQRIYADEIHQLDLIPQYYQSRNSTQDVRYYSPDKDQAITISADYEGLLWREGLWKFKQHMTVGVGDYYEWNYRNADSPQTVQSGGEFIWDWQYEHLWWWSDTVRFNYGLLHRKRSYDGDLEDQDAVFGGVNVRF